MVHKLGTFEDSLVDRQVQALVTSINQVEAAANFTILDPVFSNPASVIAGNPAPTTTIDPVFWNPASVING